MDDRARILHLLQRYRPFATGSTATTRFTDRLRRNPYPLYAVMRRIAPVFHNRRYGFWMLFDYASVRRALDDYESFSSRAAPPGGKPFDWLIFLDPPLHTKLRALVMSTFTPRAVAGLEPIVRERIDALIEARFAERRMDVVGDLAERLPLMVIGDLIGLPPGNETRLRRWADAILGLGDTIKRGAVAQAAKQTFVAATAEMRPYVEALLAERRATPKDDLLTRLVNAQVDGERLSGDDIFGFFQLLLLAGSETTTNLIGNAVLSLAEHPRELARLRANPELIPAAIEEVLRYRCPVQLVFRITTRDVQMARKTIPAGKLVLAVVGAANRDPKQFRDPNRFDAGRTPNPHIAFGHGAHFCIGATLARLEGRVALTRLLERVGDFRIVNARSWPPRQGLNVHGPRRLEIVF